MNFAAILCPVKVETQTYTLENVNLFARCPSETWQILKKPRLDPSSRAACDFEESV